MALGLAALAATAGTLAAAQPGALLARIQHGQWQLKEVGVANARLVCIADPATILQLAHGDAHCTRKVIESNPTALTVHYTCPGAGQGRSTITLRSGTAFRLQTQGLAGGMPFDFDFEARRTGDCTAAAKPAAGHPSR